MYKKRVYLIVTVLLLLSLTFCPPIMKTVRAAPTEIIVPDNYPTIQEAIDNASAGDTIRVKPGTYREYAHPHTHIFINKSVKLIGENPLNTIINGDGTRIVVHINSPNVSIIGFTIQNGGGGFADFGVYLSESAVNVTIRNNIIRNNLYGGLRLLRSTNNNIFDNKIVENYYGIVVSDNSNNNRIIGNTISNNSFGIFLDNSSNNTLYHNNFINNTIKQVDRRGTLINTWDNGAEGNYWSDYVGVDANGDGIGDTPYPDQWDPLDEHPLIEPWSLIKVFNVTINEETHRVTTNCSFTVASFNFSQLLRQISFYVTGPTGWTSYCSVTIPNALLSPNTTLHEKWLVLLDYANVTFTILPSNDTHTSIRLRINITATDPSTHRVRIRVVETENLPPFADFTYLPIDPTTKVAITFTDNSRDEDGNITSWYWNFGDGTTLNLTEPTNPTHKYSKEGTYHVTLTIKDDKNAIAIASKTITVGKMGTKLTLNVPPTSVRKTINVTAMLIDEDENPISNETVDFYVYENGVWKNSAQTNATGFASIPYTPTVVGEHLVMAVYNGSVMYAGNSSTATLIVNLIATTLTIDAPSTATSGRSVTITANLEDENGDPIRNATIKFYLFENGTWKIIGSSLTDSDGVAVLEYTPHAAGKFYIKAEFPGTQIYSKKTSHVITLSVNFDYTPYILVGVAAIAAIALIAFAIWRKRKKTSRI